MNTPAANLQHQRMQGMRRVENALGLGEGKQPSAILDRGYAAVVESGVRANVIRVKVVMGRVESIMELIGEVAESLQSLGITVHVEDATALQ